jgi:hypothetical protein
VQGIRLRNLQSLIEIGVDKNTTVVFLRPADDHRRRARCLNADAEPDDDEDDDELDPLDRPDTGMKTGQYRPIEAQRRAPARSPPPDQCPAGPDRGQDSFKNPRSSATPGHRGLAGGRLSAVFSVVSR